MFRRGVPDASLLAALIALSASAFAGWGFSGPPSPIAFIQSGNMTLELACNRMRFAPAG